jgi:hypothetical protein
MPIGIRGKKLFLNGEECFRIWKETGSVYKTAKILETQGTVNPNTGKTPSPMGIWTSAWTWILNHPAEGKQGVEEVWKNSGEILRDEDWYKLVAEKAKYLLSPKKFEEYLNNHAYLKPYR